MQAEDVVGGDGPAGRLMYPLQCLPMRGHAAFFDAVNRCRIYADLSRELMQGQSVGGEELVEAHVHAYSENLHDSQFFCAIVQTLAPLQEMQYCP